MRCGRHRAVERAQPPGGMGRIPGTAAEAWTRSRTTPRQLAARDAEPGGASDNGEAWLCRMVAAEAGAVDGGTKWAAAGYPDGMAGLYHCSTLDADYIVTSVVHRFNPSHNVQQPVRVKTGCLRGGTPVYDDCGLRPHLG